MKKKKQSILSYLVKRESGQCLRAAGRDVGHMFAEDKTTDPAVNKPCALSGQARSTFVMVFSPDGTKVASTHGDHTVRVSDIATGQCLHILRGHPRTPWTVAFHPSSCDILASGCLGGDVRIWDLKGGGSEVWKVPNSTVITSMTFHPSDRLLVIASANVVYFWDWNLPEPIVSRSTNNDYEQIRWVKFDPLGHHLFTGIANGSTVQREESLHHVSHFGYMNDGPYMDPHRAWIRRQWYDLVSRYNQHQRDEFGFRNVHTSSGRTGSTPSGSTYTQSTTQSSPLDIDLIEPTSPTRLTALDDARQYASYITNLSASSRADAGRNLTRSLASDASEGSMHTASYLSSRSLLSHGRWRYSRYHRSNQMSSAPGGAQSGTASSRINPRLTEGARNALRNLGGRTRNDDSQKSSVKQSDKTDAPSEAKVPSTLDEASSSQTGSEEINKVVKRETEKRQDSAETSQNSILFSHLSSSSESTRTSTTCTTVSSTGGQGTKTESANYGSGSRLNTGEAGGMRHRSSLLRSWLKSTKQQSSASSPCVDNTSDSSQGQSCSGHSSSQDPNRNTARSVTVIRPSTSRVDLPRILDSHPNTSRMSTEDLESRAVARVEGSGPTASTSTHCERCEASRNLVLRESLPRSPTPHRHMYRCPGPSTRSDVGCETEDNTNSSLHRSIGTETNKSASRRGSPSDSSDKKPPGGAKFRLFSSSTKRHNSTGESCDDTSDQKPDRDSDEPPRKRMKFEQSASSESVSQSQSDASSTSDAMNLSSCGKVSFESDAVCSSSSDQIKLEGHDMSDRETQQPANSNSHEPLAGHSSSVPVCSSASTTNVSQSSPSVSDSSVASSSSRDPRTSLCSMPNCSNFRSRSGPGDNSTHADCGVRMRTNLSRYHRLQDFRRRILDIHDRLQQRHRSSGRSVQDWLRAQRPPRPASFVERMESLRQERLRAERLARQRVARGRLPPGPYVIPDITITRPPDSPPHVPEADQGDHHDDRQEMLRDLENMRMEAMRERHAVRHQERVWDHQYTTQGRTWHQLQRRYLHPHYAVGILDETINQPSDSIQSAINRAIAGVYLGNGETAVANNIVDKTYRIQRWYFDVLDIPFINKPDENIVVPHCKLHNDTSAEISQDGHLLATFVPSHRGFPDDTILAVYSLEPDTLGQCWYTKGFGPNAISVSISPLNQYVLVGLAARRLAWVFSQSQQVAQVYSLCNKEEGELSMKHVTDIMHPCDSETRTHHISVNSAKWLPGPGEGIMYGTNRGDLHICRPGEKGPYTSRGEDTASAATSSTGNYHDMPSQHLRRNLMEMLGISVPRTISTATQTPPGPQRSMSTQTFVLDSDDSSSESE